MEAPIQPGALLLGKYRVEGTLGQGGMGVVVAARHLELDEIHAIKLLLPQALGDPSAADRFIREARTACRLKGEHAPRILDVGRTEAGGVYMVLELLSGADLKRIVKAHGPLSVEEAATYAHQASTALAEAHALGIVHRDIKPANLFLTRRRDGSPCVKILDFGIAKDIDAGSVELTATGAVLGSPLYMSPEQIVCTKEVGPRSDIWAMGVTLYELVTGTLPFMATTWSEVIGLVVHHEPAPPSQVRPGLPGEIDAIIARCLQKRPEHRYQRIEELSSALESLLGGAPRGLASRPSVASQPTLAPAAGPTPAAVPVNPPQTPSVNPPQTPSVNPPQTPSVNPPQTVPAGPLQAVVSTGSAWGHTGAQPRLAGGFRARALASVALGGIAIVACASWLALWSTRAGVQASTAAASASPREAPPADGPGLPRLDGGDVAPPRPDSLAAQVLSPRSEVTAGTTPTEAPPIAMSQPAPTSSRPRRPSPPVLPRPGGAPPADTFEVPKAPATQSGSPRTSREFPR